MFEEKKLVTELQDCNSQQISALLKGHFTEVVERRAFTPSFSTMSENFNTSLYADEPSSLNCSLPSPNCEPHRELEAGAE